MALPEHGDLPTFDITPADLRDQTNRLVHQVQSAVDTLVETVAPGSATVANTVRPLGDLDNAFKYEVQYIALFQSVAPSPDLRQAASDAINLLNQTYLALFQNEALFALVDVAYRLVEDEDATDESTRLLARFHRMFVDNGLQLSGADRDRFTWIAKRLLEIRVEFMDNLATDPGSLWVDQEALQGLPDRKLQSLALDDQGARGVRLDRPSVNAVLTKCRVASTRRDVFLAGQSIYPENARLFEEAVRLRSESAHLLGFPSYAVQQLRHQLVKSPEAVHELLDDFTAKLRPVASQEVQALEQIDGLEDPLHLWDFDYYHHRMLQEEYKVDHDRISEYFPAEHTLRRMFDTFEKLFGLSILEVTEKEDRHVWHPEVRVFAVRDRHEGSFLGFLYTDLYPRPGKYNHAANFNIRPGFRRKDGQQSPVATALVCNLSPATAADVPALLQHREVITVFHELGHAIHDLLGRTGYAMFTGHRTVRDFGEAPSQLLEYWCWVPECLQPLSFHYSYLPEYSDQWADSRKPPREIPDDLIEGLVAAKQVNQAILTLRQVAFSKFDMQIHTRSFHSEPNTLSPIAEIYNSHLQEMTLLRGAEGLDWGHGHATTLHYMWGQDANYFSYLYTRVLAADIWASHFRDDPMSETAALRYRRMVLEKGGSVDEAGMLRDFLGRVPRADAYFRDFGIV
ncbi:zincin [Aspergillus heteromorphus CBS 117.55]|uniref:Zincin n=1 Tax=Aspergillus heteromorphus CBS 117.55 TaxID=1448321 RepID=A0A317UVG4_9EURO|nr:zincin [Aspergillus heteromorphus CBS 117.55]PWY66014.1 zincin [Aspergillus heteromorphus CBS 117.55]